LVKKTSKPATRASVRFDRSKVAVLVPCYNEETALAKVVRDTIAEVGATSKAQMGAVMKALQEKVAGRADGKTLSQEVQKQLGS